MPVREQTAVQTLTISEAAVLALLAIEGERSPYDLMKLVSGAIGYVWAPAKTQLYAILPRLERSGLAHSRRARDGGRPEKQVYGLTSEGRRALDEWLAEEPSSTDAFFLKLFVGGLAPTRHSAATCSGSARRPARSSSNFAPSNGQTREPGTTGFTGSCCGSGWSTPSTFSSGRTGSSASWRKQ